MTHLIQSEIYPWRFENISTDWEAKVQNTTKELFFRRKTRA